ncbi:MAG: HAD family hydrolase, partial [Lachnospiraceae bacterium]|nr:HAD family hydrolase [Lachnospiraceae bacterium]
INCIDGGGYFEVTGLSADDAGRNRMYKENAKRADLQASFADYGEYLTSLEMKGEIENFKPVYYARITQLTNKSNQFNLTTKRYTQTQIEALAEDKDHITLYGRLSDRFGDNGVVSVVIGRVEGDVCHMDLWLMSCRVLKRDMEYAMMDAVVAECQKRGISMIRGYYYPTAKNGMVKGFYRDMGFELVNENDKGDTEWEFNIPSEYEHKNRYIDMTEE